MTKNASKLHELLVDMLLHVWYTEDGDRTPAGIVSND